ncbi:MAG: M28 family metallopeptidase [bacterium]
MKRILFALMLVAIFFGSLFSQKAQVKNPLVAKMINEVSEKNLRQIIEKLVSFGTRHTLSDTISTSRGIGAARRWIKSEYERYAAQSSGRMTVEFHETVIPPSARVPNPAKVVNVVATLKGRDAGTPRERILVVGGHYDTRASGANDVEADAPGANDDGSGTALAMELARVLSKYEFDATIVFIAFAAEEQGLLGAQAWAEMAKRNKWNVEAVLNNDMVSSTVAGDGTKENKYIRVFSEAFAPQDTGAVLRQKISQGLENDGGSRSLARYIKEVGERYVPKFEVKLVYRLDRFGRGGDHRPFHERGFAAVRFCEPKENYDHQHQNIRTENEKEYGDLVKFIDFQYFTKVTKVNGAVLATLALAPAPPVNVRMSTQQSYDTNLRWNHVPSSNPAGYLVRYRETSSAFWQHALFTTDTTLTVKAHKDDFLFGVQAIDGKGNGSLIVVPKVGAR